MKFNLQKKQTNKLNRLYKIRNCSNPTPQFGGTFCIGSAIDTILCNVSNVTCPSKFLT